MLAEGTGGGPRIGAEVLALSAADC